MPSCDTGTGGALNVLSGNAVQLTRHQVERPDVGSHVCCSPVLFRTLGRPEPFRLLRLRLHAEGRFRQAARDSSFDRTASERHVRRPRLQDHVKRSSAKYLSGSACNHACACPGHRTRSTPAAGLCAAKEAGRNRRRLTRAITRATTDVARGYTGPKHIQLNHIYSI